jgi:hypothetical protein
VASMCFVIIRECAVKRVLSWRKLYRDIITPTARIWVIKTAVAFGPLFVPRTGAIWDEIMSAWLFADPKDCRYDTCFPRIGPRTLRGGRFSDDGLVFFSDRFDLSGKGRIKCDEESETKKATRRALYHYFPIGSRSKTACSGGDIFHVSRCRLSL